MRKHKKTSAAQLASMLIISAGEARKILGADAKDMTEEDIVLLIVQLQEIARMLIYTSISPEKQL